MSFQDLISPLHIEFARAYPICQFLHILGLHDPIRPFILACDLQQRQLRCGLERSRPWGHLWNRSNELCTQAKDSMAALLARHLKGQPFQEVGARQVEPPCLHVLFISSPPRLSSEASSSREYVWLCGPACGLGEKTDSGGNTAGQGLPPVQAEIDFLPSIRVQARTHLEFPALDRTTKKWTPREPRHDSPDITLVSKTIGQLCIVSPSFFALPALEPGLQPLLSSLGF